MRVSNVILGLAGVGAVAALGLAGCGTTGGNTGGAGGGATASSTTGTATTTSSGGACSGSPCSPTAACTAADLCCIGLVDNSSLTTFGLRMSELDVSAPAKLATGIVPTIIAGDVEPDNAACNLGGTADFNWLLQFDTTANTLKTGCALPVTDATSGYSFVSTTIGTNMVAPVTYTDVTIAADGSFSTTPLSGKLYVPIYLDASGSEVVVLPILNPAIGMSTLSANHNCIGSFNAAGLSPSMNCLSTTTVPTFIDGGSLNGLITLADADTVPIAQLSETLCVLLTGEKGMTVNGITQCPTDANGNITATGDACSTAGGTCMDSFTLTANFAASSIKINP